MDYFRLIWGSVVSLFIVVGLLWLAYYLINKYGKKGLINKKLVIVSTIVLCVSFLIFVINSLSVNEFPRSVIDRSDINSQIQNTERNSNVQN